MSFVGVVGVVGVVDGVDGVDVVVVFAAAVVGVGFLTVHLCPKKEGFPAPMAWLFI